jgi:cell fate regulator YaaT (PSP1 superfamily)
MKHRTELLLLNTFTTIAVKFKDTEKLYTFKIPKDWKVSVEDTVVVKGTSGLTTARVAQVHTEPKLDNSIPKYAWIVQVVDQTEYTKLLERDEQIEKILQQADMQETRKKFLAGLPEGTRVLLQDLVPNVSTQLEKI